MARRGKAGNLKEVQMNVKTQVQNVVGRLFEQNGEVTASALVEEARPKTSPIHSAFEWDNVKAGEQYRLWQARQWIRRVDVIVEDRQERLIHVPRVSVEGEDREGFYKPVSMVVRHENEYAAALGETLDRFNAAKRAYGYLKASKTAIALDFEKIDQGFQMVEEALTA